MNEIEIFHHEGWIVEAEWTDKTLILSVIRPPVGGGELHHSFLASIVVNKETQKVKLWEKGMIEFE